MNKLKRLFGMPWVMLVFVASIHSAIMIVLGANRLAWLGAALALWPIAFFFRKLMTANKGRAPSTMKLQLVCAAAGTVLTVIQFHMWPFIYAAVIGVVGILLYDYWYSRIAVPENTNLKTEGHLPDFQVLNERGEKVSSQSWVGKPLLLMFIRGNWCPLCVAQVSELSEHYQQLAAREVRLVIVSGQPVDETLELAKKFSVPFEFYSDPGGLAAKTIGLQHEGGTPLGMVRYSADTVIPTVVICDAEGVIRYLDIAENYRDRPNPDQFLTSLGI